MGHMMLPRTLSAKQDVWDGMHYMPYLHFLLIHDDEKEELCIKANTMTTCYITSCMWAVFRGRL